MRSIYGKPVIIVSSSPRYTLPSSVPPPPGMAREEFHEWSLRVCGTNPPIIKDDQVVAVGDSLYMTEATWRRVMAAAQEGI